MFKDKQRLVILAAIVILFLVLSDGGFGFHMGELNWFNQRTWTTIGFIALAWWFLAGGGRNCCGRRCGGHEEEEDAGEKKPGTGDA
jgi:hypothetical protein